MGKTQKYVEGRKKYTKPYLLNEEIGVYVNPNYLIDMMECLPNAKVYAASPVGVIYFKADNGDGSCSRVGKSKICMKRNG